MLDLPLSVIVVDFLVVVVFVVVSASSPVAFLLFVQRSTRLSVWEKLALEQLQLPAATAIASGSIRISCAYQVSHAAKRDVDETRATAQLAGWQKPEDVCHSGR